MMIREIVTVVTILFVDVDRGENNEATTRHIEKREAGQGAVSQKRDAGEAGNARPPG